ncbi:hypothetical protein DPEC_G00198890 [Dallia pectoralis]|uniref:Uncharacterized protein n=1 Tax=Dallia pectoralis TaxID=75939 RepID=A0ACC2G8M3_DALPE|nr:hypothetical protein DPEC_G00198890 [Dallia pectoralis]
MEEYYASEADAREARPRRQTRPPQHLHDYEVSYGNHRPHLSPYHSVVEHNSPESQEEQYSHQERAAKMDSFTSLRLTPPTYQAQWDAVPQWDNPSHHHGGYGPEMQLAHSRQRGRGGPAQRGDQRSHASLETLEEVGRSSSRARYDPLRKQQVAFNPTSHNRTNG